MICKKDMTMDEFNQIKAANNDFEKSDDKECLETGGLEAIGIFGL